MLPGLNKYNINDVSATTRLPLMTTTPNEN